MSSNRETIKFLFGFAGMISLGLTLLVAIGFYQVEIAGTKNLSAPEANISHTGAVSR